MILRKMEDVEIKDVGKYFGFAEGMHFAQWIVSNTVGDERYQHNFAVRKFKTKPGAKLEDTPFHHHAYEQCPYLLKGHAIFENYKREQFYAGPGDTVYIHSNEPHRMAVVGDEDVELFCVIDCPGDGSDCDPVTPPRGFDQIERISKL